MMLMQRDWMQMWVWQSSLIDLLVAATSRISDGLRKDSSWDSAEMSFMPTFSRGGWSLKSTYLGT